MTLLRDKKRAQVTTKAAVRKTRARVAKEQGEGDAARVRLPPWRELVGAGPAEGQHSAVESEEASAPTALVEQVPAEAKEDVATPDQPGALAAESPVSPPLEIEAPLDEPEVGEAPVDEAVEPELGSALEPEPEPAQSSPGTATEPVAEPAAPEPVEAAPEDAPVLRRSRTPAMLPVERLARARSLARVSRGEALPSALQTLLPGMPAPLLHEAFIHTDTAAARAAECLHADAFTIGTHVYFAEGRFAVQSSDGMALLAHELAHVAQYRAGRLAGVPPVSQPSDAVEREADGWAARWSAPAPAPALEGDGNGAADTAPAGVVTEGDHGAAENAARDTAQALEPVNDGWTRPRSAVPSDGPVLRRATDAAKTFFDKSYFAQADEWNSVSGDIDGSLASDAQATTAAFPTPQAELGPAAQPPTPAPAAPTTLSLGEQVPEPGADSGPVEAAASETAAAPATPATPRISFGADGDSSAAQRNFSAALDQVPTSLDSLQTSPGPTPPVELTGSADPAQAAEQAQTADQQAEALRDQAAANVDNGPGPEQVQPRSVHEARPVAEAQAPTSEPLAEIGRMTEIEATGTVTDEIQTQTDALGQAQIDATLAESKTQLDDAATQADEQQAEEARSAEEENARLNAEANAEQEAAVSEARTNIETDKEDTKRQQQEQVDEAQVESEEERQRLADDVDARVAEDEQRIDGEFSDAARDAEQEKDHAEAEAERKKREAERDAENDSWWDRLADAIASAFAALTSFINDVFDAAISAVGTIIDAVKEAAAAIINAARDFVVSALQALGDVLTGLIDDLLGDIFPELAAALTDLVNAAVDLAVSAVNALADALIAGINALLDAIGAAITAVLEAYRAAINVALAFAQALLTGDWAALGRMILEAVLTIAGIPPAAFYALIDQAMGALDTIIDDPGAFVGNVINAVAEGFQSFADNILAHLQEGFFRWIVGPLGELGITLPTRWDVVGILGLVLQVLGLTAAGIRNIIVEVLGEAAGAIFDFVWRYVDALITGGWAGLWEQIQNDLSQLWGTVVDGIKDYLIETIVVQAVLRIATMFNPVGALLNAVMMVWNVYNFLRTNIQRIWGVVTAIVDMLATIAAGNITPAARAVENAVASLIPIAISLLANLLGLGGLTTKVREVLESLRAAVRNAIVSLVRRVQGLFGGGRGDGAAEESAEAGGDTVLGEDQPASGAGESHTVHIDTRGSDAVLEVRTTPTPAEQWVANLLTREPWSGFTDDDAFIAKRDEALRLAAQVNTEADQIAATIASHAGSENPPAVEDDSVEAKQARFAAAVTALLQWGRAEAPIEDPLVAFQPNLEAADSNAKRILERAIEANTEAFAAAASWDAAKPLFEGNSVSSPMFNTPLNQSHMFGSAAHSGQLVPAVERALQDLGAEPEQVARAGNFAVNYKAQVHSASAPFARSKEEMKTQVFDQGYRDSANATLYSEYKQKLEEEPEGSHAEFMPRSLSVSEDGTTLTYQTTGGASFAVSRSVDGMLRAVQGSNLRHKSDLDIAGTGYRGDSPAFVTDRDMNRAHVIADQFLGSGYKRAGNLITTSAQFNQQTMGEIETRIKQEWVDFLARVRVSDVDVASVSFELDVSIEWGDLNSSAVLPIISSEIGSALLGRYPHWDKHNLEQEIYDKLQTHLIGASPNLRRVKNITYSLTLVGPGGWARRFNTGWDVWLGFPDLRIPP